MAARPQRSLAERRPDVARRFAGFVVPGADGCQLWTGYTHKGTPKFFFRDAHPARKIALQLAGVGPGTG